MAWDNEDGLARRSLLYGVAALIFLLGLGYAAFHPDDRQAAGKPDLDIQTGAGDDGQGRAPH